MLGREEGREESEWVREWANYLIEQTQKMETIQSASKE